MSAIPNDDFSWDDGWEHEPAQPGERWDEGWDDGGWTDLDEIDGREGRSDWASWAGQLVLVGLLLPLVLVLLAALLIAVL